MSKNDNRDNEAYRSIIGLGNFSGRKSYFPELQKKIEELKIEKDKYQRIFTEALHGIIQFKITGEVIEANPAMIELCNDDSLLSLKKRIRDFRINLFAQSSDVEKFIRTLKSNGSVKNYETRFIQSGGNLLDVSLNAIWQKGDYGEFIECFVQDITERKRNELELKHYREELEQMVHERTAELKKQNLELEKFNQLFVGREFRIKELRDKLKKLEKK